MIVFAPFDLFSTSGSRPSTACCARKMIWRKDVGSTQVAFYTKCLPIFQDIMIIPSGFFPSHRHVSSH